MKRLFLPLALLAALSCSDSTEPNVFGSLTFNYTGGGSGTFTAQGGVPSFDAPSTTISWAVGYTENGETFVAASKPRSGQNVDMAILRIQRTTVGSEPIDTGCDEDGAVACTVMVLFLNFNGNGDTGDWFCALTSGTIVVTEISSRRTKGTFSGSGNCAGGGVSPPPPTTFTVTNGAFDVAITPAPTG